MARPPAASLLVPQDDALELDAECVGHRHCDRNRLLHDASGRGRRAAAELLEGVTASVITMFRRVGQRDASNAYVNEGTQ